MLFLNNPLLTSQRILEFFEHNLVHKETKPVVAEYTVLKINTLPNNYNKYKNNYLMIDGDLYYTGANGTREATPLLLPDSVRGFLNSVTKTKAKLTQAMVDELVVLNPHHEPTLFVPPPSELSQLQNKLKAIFFENLDKTTSNQAVLEAIEADERFKVDYFQLKDILKIIFSLSDADNLEQALSQLKSLSSRDWDADKAEARFKQLNTKHGYFDESALSFNMLQDVFYSGSHCLSYHHCFI